MADCWVRGATDVSQSITKGNDCETTTPNGHHSIQCRDPWETTFGVAPSEIQMNVTEAAYSALPELFFGQANFMKAMEGPLRPS